MYYTLLKRTSLDAAQGVSEERSKLYSKIQRPAPKLTTQRCAKDVRFNFKVFGMGLVYPSDCAPYQHSIEDIALS